MAKTTKMFEIKFRYFKSSGKYYAEGSAQMEAQALGENGDIAYMDDIVETIKKWRREKIPFPGLIGIWDGYIMVDCEQGFPVLIMPFNRGDGCRR